METLTLEKVDQMNADEYTPVIVLLTLVILFGLTGNILAAIFYIKKAKQNVLHVFISCLSVNDAIINIVLVQEIVQLFSYLSGKNVITCKLFLVLKHWIVGNSLFFLVAISADRYRRVCFPFSKQITYTLARFVILGLTLFSFIITSRNIATTDVFKFNITADRNSTITGFYCTYSKEKVFALVHDIFHIIDICIHGCIMCSFVTLNVLLIRKVMQTKQKLKTNGLSISFKINELQNETSALGSSTEVVDINFDSDDDNRNDREERQRGKKEDNGRMENNPRVKTDTLKRNHERFRRKLSNMHAARTEMKITIMVVVITVISALCFVPYYVAMLTVKQDFSGSSRIMSVAEILARRSYILNSAVNPFVLVIFNVPFRQFVYSVISFKCLKGRNMSAV